jgi:hypothetical protein
MEHGDRRVMHPNEVSGASTSRPARTRSADLAGPDERLMSQVIVLADEKFGSHVHDPRGRRDRAGSLKAVSLPARIEAFVAWANREALSHGLVGEAIPDDPEEKIGIGRFRRSLAWHIARRPNGHVALAVPYGHMRTAFRWSSEGYSGRSRSGIHDLIDLGPPAPSPTPSWKPTRASRTAAASPARRPGASSGPAALAPRFAGTPITLTSARKLLKNEDAMIFDNPHALVLCHYKADRALCHRDGVKDTPSLDRCVPGCGNIARTDQHATRLRERALAFERQAGHVTHPVGDRLRAAASGSATRPKSMTAPGSCQATTQDEPRVRRAGQDPGRNRTGPGRNPRTVQRGADHCGARHRSRRPPQRAHPVAHRPEG